MLGGDNSHSGEDQSARLRERLFQIVKKYYQMNIKSKINFILNNFILQKEKCCTFTINRNTVYTILPLNFDNIC